MDTTQFAMVEELASLIKDNLYSKHIVLSTEEALITLLHQQSYDDDDDHRGTVSRNTIELQPASSYHRLLLHRLADIYGFAHESVGEGEDRHLVLQRCPETAIPPVLVSDVLWQYDSNDVSASVVLTRNDTDHQKVWKAEDFQEAISVESSHLKADTDLKPLEQSVPVAAASLREREAAYRAARERIFSAHDAKGKDTSVAKPRHVPVVAQRMIAHALGKKVENPTETAALVKDKGKEMVSGPNIPTSSRNNLYAVTAGTKEESYLGKGNSRSTGGDSYRNPYTESKSCRGVSAEKLKKEEIGAAKRMFAHALRLPAVQGSEGAAAWKPK